jgi:hypothetical protein
MLAGIGAGVYANVDDALQQVTFTTECATLEMDAHRAYSDRFERVYRPTAAALRDVYGAIDTFI